MTDLRKAAQAIIDAVHSRHCLLEFRDCALIEELAIALKASGQAPADAPADVPRIAIDDEQWQAFQDKLDSPVQDKPELAKLLRGDVDALIAEIESIPTYTNLYPPFPDNAPPCGKLVQKSLLDEITDKYRGVK